MVKRKFIVYGGISIAYILALAPIFIQYIFNNENSIIIIFIHIFSLSCVVGVHIFVYITFINEINKEHEQNIINIKHDNDDILNDLKREKGDLLIETRVKDEKIREYLEKLNRIPKLNLFLNENGNNVNEITIDKRGELKKYKDFLNIEEKLQERRDQLILKRDDFKVSTSAVGNFVKKEEHIFIEELDKYMNEYREYLENKKELYEYNLLNFTLNLIIENSGTVQANEVFLFLQYPNIIDAYNENESPTEMVKPSPPDVSKLLPNISLQEAMRMHVGTQKSLTDLTRLVESVISPINDFHTMDNRIVLPMEMYQGERERTFYGPINLGNNEYKYWWKNILHNMEVNIENIQIAFKSIKDLNSFEINYSILCQEISNPILGIIVFNIQI